MMIETIFAITLALAQLAQMFPFPGPGVPGGSLTSWVTSVSGGNTRNDFDGTVGCRFTVGGSPISMKKIGRYCYSGNSQAHAAYLSNSGGSDIATASIDMAGCTPGTVVYATMVQTLAAGTTYMTGTVEASGGDVFLDDDSTVSVTGVASLDASAYSAGAGFGSFNPHTSGKCYVPVTFQY